MRRSCFVAVMLMAGYAGPLVAVPPADSPVDPNAIVRYGQGYRYPQAGWIVVHVEGDPYERGFQHGQLLAEEIENYIRCFATMQSYKSPNDGWRLTRSMVNALFLRQFDREYLEEMRGIADGAADAGARFDNRPIDLTDIAAGNLWAELMTLDSATAATPTGLEDTRFRSVHNKTQTPPSPERCSAFAATGKATADGKIVFGHISMFMLYPSSFFNVWLDVQPTKGHRVMMQSYPGGIYSGMDYYMTDAGMIACETTISQTGFNAAGQTLASRMRKAMQYSDSIDGIVSVLREGNNGLYTNEWLLADTKTNEIAMFELGTRASRLYRSSKNEWFGGSEGFYWGCNNVKDAAVRLETIASTQGHPANMVWAPSDRDTAWLKMYEAHKGKIGVDFAREAFTTPPICGFSSLDAKFTTSAMTKGLKSYALFGPPMGRVWQPTTEEERKYPAVTPMVGNPWTILQARDIPDADDDLQPTPTDLATLVYWHATDPDRPDDDSPPSDEPEWHGTLLPKTDADVWLTTGFCDYERLFSQEQDMATRSATGCMCNEDRDKAASSLFAERAKYLAAVAESHDTALDQIKSDVAKRDWYDIASGKGVLVLNELRNELEESAFVDLMEAFGAKYAGKSVDSADFIAFATARAHRDLKSFFAYWLGQSGLPRFSLVEAALTPIDGGDVSGTQAVKAALFESEADEPGRRIAGRVVPKNSRAKGAPPESDDDAEGPVASYSIAGRIGVENGPLPGCIEMTAEHETGEETTVVPLESDGRFKFDTENCPLRLIVDKYGRTAKANGGRFAVNAFTRDIEHTLIVYGTIDDAAANHEAARALQKALIVAWFNREIPIKSDTEVTAEQLKSNHLLLVGRPATNRIVERFRAAFPVTFGTQSVRVRQETLAHPLTAILAATANPLNERRSITLVAGLSAAATYRAATGFTRSALENGAEVVILDRGGNKRAVVVPAPELTKVLAKR